MAEVGSVTATLSINTKPFIDGLTQAQTSAEKSAAAIASAIDQSVDTAAAQAAEVGKTVGDSVSQAMGGAADAVDSGIKMVNGRLRDAGGRFVQMKDIAADAMITVKDSVTGVERQVKASDLAVEQSKRTWADFQKNMKSVGESMTSVGKTLSFYVTTPLVGLGTFALKTAIDFETAFTGVQKTVDASAEEFAMLEQQIRQMSTEIPQSTTAIAAVMESAGQLGIAKENLLGFTETILQLQDTTEGLDDAAGTLARFANITGMSQTEFDRLGSTIVDLGNKLATTEGEIAAMGLRLAGAGAQIGLSEAQILSFAAALSSVGIEAEAGGSAMSKVFRDMALAVTQGGERLSEFANVAGMSADDFKRAFEQDAGQAIVSFIAGLKDTERLGKTTIEILDEMGFTEVRLADALSRASNASDLFADSIAIGTNAWKENTALSAEAEKRYATTASQLKVLWNRLVDVSLTLGETLMPILIQVMEYVEFGITKLDEWAKSFTELDKTSQTVILALAGLAIAIPPVTIALGALVTAATTLFAPAGIIVAGISVVAGLYYEWTRLYDVQAELIEQEKDLNAAINEKIAKWPKVTEETEEATAAMKGQIETLLQNKSAWADVLPKEDEWERELDRIKTHLTNTVKSIEPELKKVTEVVKNDFSELFEEVLIPESAKDALNITVELNPNISFAEFAKQQNDLQETLKKQNKERLDQEYKDVQDYWRAVSQLQREGTAVEWAYERMSYEQLVRASLNESIRSTEEYNGVLKENERTYLTIAQRSHDVLQNLENFAAPLRKNLAYANDVTDVLEGWGVNADEARKVLETTALVLQTIEVIQQSIVLLQSIQNANQLAVNIAKGIELAVDIAIAGVMTVINALSGGLLLAIGLIITLVVSLFDGWESVGDMVEKVWKTITGFFSKLTRLVKDALKAVGNFFGDLLESFGNLGIQILEGLWQGIENAAGWFWDKLTGFANKIVDTIKDALDIFSPSKVMADQVGKFLPQGIAVGFEADIPESFSKMKSQLNQAVKGLVPDEQIQVAYNLKPAADASNAVSYSDDRNSRQVTGGSNTFNFYSPKNIDAVEARRQFESLYINLRSKGVRS